MAFHTVWLPPHDPLQAPVDQLGQARFLKDGFSLFAFIFTGFWLLKERLWLALLVFVLVWAALAFGGRAFGLNPLGLGLAQILIGVYLGLEGAALVEGKLSRLGWRFAGVIEGKDLDTVERRFFEMAAAGGIVTANAPIAPLRTVPASGAVLGLFPDPGVR